jgi:hypothetical protein
LLKVRRARASLQVRAPVRRRVVQRLLPAAAAVVAVAVVRAAAAVVAVAAAVVLAAVELPQLRSLRHGGPTGRSA